MQLGRLLRRVFRTREALVHFSDALRLAPDSASVIYEYAMTTPDVRLEAALWRRLLTVPDAPTEWQAQAVERLRVYEALRGREPNRLDSADRACSIPMPVARSAENRPVGWVIRARINNGPDLRLLVDTGSRGILIGRRVAERLGLETLAETVHRGFGEGESSRGWVMLARRLSIGELEFENPIVEATPRDYSQDIDGLIGIELFRGLRITLDGPGQRLVLEPHGDEQDLETSLTRAGHLLVADGHAASHQARVLIDSGAAYSMLPNSTAAVAVRRVALRGLSGEVAAQVAPMRIPVAIGGYRGVLGEAVYTDLAPLSESIGMRLDAVAGFPFLRRLVTTIDLRTGGLEMRGP
jgi:predicted aspartyl protease